jgi:hypothetical protein
VEPPTEQGPTELLPIVGDIKRKKRLRIENESILTDVKKRIASQRQSGSDYGKFTKTLIE